MDQKTLSAERPSRLGIFDITKYVLALMIIAIHSELFPLALYPWLRVAVPLFFVISSYFFFSKISNTASEQEKNKKWLGYVKRNAVLYLFWFIVLIPITLSLRQYFNDGALKGIHNFTKSLLFSSTFPASWYIQASIVAVSIIFLASKKLNNTTLLCIAVPIYAFATLRSSYVNVIEANAFLSKFYEIYEMIFGAPMFNACSALVWIVVGKCFAEGKIKIKAIFAAIGLAVSCALLYAEWLFVRSLNGTFNNDCYLLLIPTTIFAFQLLLLVKIPANKLTSFMGKSSTIIYTTHMPLILIATPLMIKFLSINSKPLMFVFAAVVCTSGSLVVFWLEKFKIFKWLKYSH